MRKKWACEGINGLCPRYCIPMSQANRKMCNLRKTLSESKNDYEKMGLSASVNL